MDYFQQQKQDESQKEQKSPFVDKSAQLNATLNSLAMNNIATILHKQKRQKDFKESIQNLAKVDKQIITEIQSDKEEEEKKK